MNGALDTNTKKNSMETMQNARIHWSGHQRETTAKVFCIWSKVVLIVFCSICLSAVCVRAGISIFAHPRTTVFERISNRDPLVCLNNSGQWTQAGMTAGWSENVCPQLDRCFVGVDHSIDPDPQIPIINDCCLIDFAMHTDKLYSKRSRKKWAASGFSSFRACVGVTIDIILWYHDWPVMYMTNTYRQAGQRPDPPPGPE